MIEDKANLFVQALKDGVIPAVGCTEPIAVAFAAATAMDYMNDQKIKKVVAKVSPNVMKNAMAVIVPGTGKSGLFTAIAAGIISGDSSKGLSVISELNKEDVKKIKQLVAQKIIDLQVAPVEDDLYVEVTIENVIETVTVWIAGEHTNVFKIQKNDSLIKSERRPLPHMLSETKKCYKNVHFERFGILL